MSKATVYRWATDTEEEDGRHTSPSQWVRVYDDYGEFEGLMVPVEPDIDAAKAESDRQQGGPGLSRHKIAKIVNAAYAGIGADDE